MIPLVYIKCQTHCKIELVFRYIYTLLLMLLCMDAQCMKQVAVENTMLTCPNTTVGKDNWLMRKNL